MSEERTMFQMALRGYRLGRNFVHQLRYGRTDGGYVEEAFWEARHRRYDSSFSAVGGGDPAEERTRYPEQRAAFEQFLADGGIALAGKLCVELGSGNGFWSEVVLEAGAGDYLGFDISATSIENSRARHPRASFDQCDLGVEHAFLRRMQAPFTFSIDVTQHVTQRSKILAFLGNMERATAPGGDLVLTSYSGFGDKVCGPPPTGVRRWFAPLAFVALWDEPTLSEGLSGCTLERVAPFWDKKILHYRRRG